MNRSLKGGKRCEPAAIVNYSKRSGETNEYSSITRPCGSASHGGRD